MAASMPKKTIPELHAMRDKGEPVAFLSLYDAPTAAIAEKAGADMILVGDSVGMVVYGMAGTVGVTMETMIAHTRAVRRGAPHTLVVGDMPFLSYQPSDADAVRNAGRFLAEAEADAVKVEGGVAAFDRIRAISRAGIAVMGHVGLTPQSAAALGGFKTQGRTAEAAARLLDDARAVEDAGAFSVIVEAIPPPVAAAIRRLLKVPVYGVGAGPGLDGQVLIAADLLGLFEAYTPKFVKRYASLSQAIAKAFGAYLDDVREERFPASEHAYWMSESELQSFEEILKRRGLSTKAAP